MNTKTDTRTAAELVEAVRAGDTTVGPDDITAARAREEYENLQAEAASRAELAAIQAQHQQKLAELRDDVAAVADPAAIVDATHKAAEALDALATAIVERNNTIDALVRRARTLNVPEASGEGVARHPSGLGWRAGAGRDSVLIDGDRAIHTKTVLDLFDRLVGDVATRHRLHQRTARKGLAPAVAEQLAGLDHVRTAPAQVEVSLLRRWGKSQPGTTVTTDVDTAAWLRRTGVAT